MTLARQPEGSIPRRDSARRQRRRAGKLDQHLAPIVVAAVALVTSLIASDWIAGLGIVVLSLIWFLLAEEGRTPVLPLAVTFQWVQVTCGVYYLAFTGRELEAHYASDYRPMVLIGLGCVLALTVGLAIALRMIASGTASQDRSTPFTVSWRALLIAYVVTSILGVLVREIAWSVPGLAQAILAVGFVRLGVLFLIFRRLVHRRFHAEWFFGFLILELMLGFTGYFASFREPLMLSALALLEVFRTRSVAHWLRMFAVVGLMAVTGLVWIAIRSVYRAEIDSGELGGSRVERLARVQELSSDWLTSGAGSAAEDVDRLVERMWPIYYPALAIARVPEILPYEDGAILQAAVTHLVTPRILFPDKGTLPSDSEMVRKYAGVYVASTEEGTSIAFGYAAEAYIDFGLPWMFVPSILFGVFIGVAYRGVFRVIKNPELAVGLASVVFWLSLYLFERSWIKTLGMSVTLLIAIGGIAWVLDRFLARKPSRARTRLPSARRGAGGPARARLARSQ